MWCSQKQWLPQNHKIFKLLMIFILFLQMPRRCSVLNCMNVAHCYHKKWRKTETVWVWSIHRENFVPGPSARVCIKQFVKYLLRGRIKLNEMMAYGWKYRSLWIVFCMYQVDMYLGLVGRYPCLSISSSSVHEIVYLLDWRAPIEMIIIHHYYFFTQWINK
jgi:hypothetical protein